MLIGSRPSLSRSLRLLQLGLKIQGRVVLALILREMLTRYGRGGLGYLWAFLEPLLLVGYFLLLFSAFGKESHMGMELVPFLATGIVTFTALRSTVSRLSSAIESNRGLLTYPHVTPLDTMLARSLLEGATFFVVFVIIISGSWLLNLAQAPDNWLGVLLALAAGQVLGTAWGMVEWALVLTLPTLERVMGVFWRLLMWGSCVFHTLNDLPLEAQHYMALNPIVHVIELLRQSFFPGYISPITSYSYLIGWIAVCLFIGLLCERSLRGRS